MVKPNTKNTKKGKGKAKSPKLSKQQRDEVQALIHADTEDKQLFLSSGNTLVSFNSGISGASDMLQVIPNQTKGTNSGDRIGDVINVNKYTISGYVRLGLKTQSGTFFNEPKLSNVICRLFVLSMKSNVSYNAAIGQPGILTSLLKKGLTTSSFTGVLSDVMAPVNTDVFTVHHDQSFYLTQDYNFLPTTGTYANSSVAIDVRDSIKFFKIKMKTKSKKWRYDSVNGEVLPMNYGPFMCLGYAYLDGSAPDSLSTQVQMFYQAEVLYEDA